MSRIYFHSEHGEAELNGSERAYMDCLCKDLMFAAIGDLRWATWLQPLIPPTDPAPRADEFYGRHSALSLWLTSHNSDFIVDGTRVSTWSVTLNTALAIGGDTIKLLARLHGQCEIHCWVSGPNRRWLAGLMREGRASGIMRPNQGWEAVADFLESRDDGAVVCSYSVTDQFPNYETFPEAERAKLQMAPDDEERREAFYRLPFEEQWRACLTGLDEMLELRPDRWNGYVFFRGYSVFTLPRVQQSVQQSAANP